MWVFYHDVTQGVAAHVPSDATVFVALGVVAAAIIMAPSFFEKMRK